jgi:hypothetical protein
MIQFFQFANLATAKNFKKMLDNVLPPAKLLDLSKATNTEIRIFIPEKDIPHQEVNYDDRLFLSKFGHIRKLNIKDQNLVLDLIERLKKNEKTSDRIR